MHVSDDLGFRQRIHVDIKFVHQTSDSSQFTCFLIRSGLHAVFLFISRHISSQVLVLLLGVEGQGLNGGWMSAALEFHGQLCRGFTEVAQRKS